MLRIDCQQCYRDPKYTYSNQLINAEIIDQISAIAHPTSQKKGNDPSLRISVINQDRLNLWK